MGEVVTGKGKAESRRQQSPGICRVFAMKREQENEEKGNSCPLGKEGNWARMCCVIQYASLHEVRR